MKVSTLIPLLTVALFSLAAAAHSDAAGSTAPSANPDPSSPANGSDSSSVVHVEVSGWFVAFSLAWLSSVVCLFAPDCPAYVGARLGQLRRSLDGGYQPLPN